MPNVVHVDTRNFVLFSIRNFVQYNTFTLGPIQYARLWMSSYASRNASRTTSHATAAARSAAAVACDVVPEAFHDANIHTIPMQYHTLGWK